MWLRLGIMPGDHSLILVNPRSEERRCEAQLKLSIEIGTDKMIPAIITEDSSIDVTRNELILIWRIRKGRKVN